MYKKTEENNNNNYNNYNNFLFVWRKFESEYDGKTECSNNTNRNTKRSVYCQYG